MHGSEHKLVSVIVWDQMTEVSFLILLSVCGRNSDGEGRVGEKWSQAEPGL